MSGPKEQPPRETLRQNDLFRNEVWRVAFAPAEGITISGARKGKDSGGI